MNILMKNSTHSINIIDAFERMDNNQVVMVYKDEYGNLSTQKMPKDFFYKNMEKNTSQCHEQQIDYNKLFGCNNNLSVNIDELIDKIATKIAVLINQAKKGDKKDIEEATVFVGTKIG